MYFVIFINLPKKLQLYNLMHNIILLILQQKIEETEKAYGVVMEGDHVAVAGNAAARS